MSLTYLQLDNLVFELVNLTSACNVFESFLVSVFNGCELVLEFLAVEVELLDCIDDSAEFNRKSLLVRCDSIKRYDLFLVLAIDPEFVLSDVLEVFGELFAGSSEHLAHVVMDRAFDVITELYDHLGVPSALFDVFVKTSSATLSLDQFQVFLNSNQLHVHSVNLGFPFCRGESCLKDLLVFGLFKKLLLVIVRCWVEEVDLGLLNFALSDPAICAWAQQTFTRHDLVLKAPCIVFFNEDSVQLLRAVEVRVILQPGVCCILSVFVFLRKDRHVKLVLSAVQFNVEQLVNNMANCLTKTLSQVLRLTVLGTVSTKLLEVTEQLLNRIGCVAFKVFEWNKNSEFLGLNARCNIFTD